MVQAHRIKTIAIAGCTAVGKSQTALMLAKKFNGELVGADSMQIYRGFDIGTGKLSEAECDGIKHHMIDIVDGDADFSVGEYVSLARTAIEDIACRGKLPIVVGGTGLYIKSLFSGNNFADAPKDADLRNSIKFLSHFIGPCLLHFMLERVDAGSAKSIAANDVKRVIRALEIYAIKGVPKSDVVGIAPPYDDLTVVLTLPRDILYERINKRVHSMFENGLIDEARSLIRYKDHGSMQALGYKQIAAYPHSSREELEELVATKTRNYAKRQITFFKHAQINKVFIDARDRIAIEDTVRRFTES